MLLYSPRKNIAKVIAEYSTLQPATNSASASGKSKGVLFVSANIEIKKIMKQGSNGNKNLHESSYCCCMKTISVKFSELVNSTTGRIVKPNDTSYEIICADERKLPKKAYLELLDQPAKIIP